MVAQKLRPTRAALLLDGAEHVRQIVRVVTGARHDLRTEHVGLRLILATELQEIDADTELRTLPDDCAGHAADDRTGNRADAAEDRILLRFRGLRRAVPERDVRQLVRHHAGHLAFIVRRFDHAAIDVHRPARQSEGVDLALIDDLQ